MSRHHLRALAVAALVALPLVACGDDDGAATDTSAPSPGTVDEADEPIAIAGAWARTSPSMATAGAAYAEITNAGDEDDALIGVSVDPSVADRAELHETVPADDDQDDDATGGGHGGGMMHMRAVEEIPVPAGGTAVLEPGGYHVMLLDLAAPLEVGDTVEITFTFERAGEDVTVMPERLVLQVGQTLRIRNEDGEAARVGPYEVPARDELSVRFGRPGRFEGYCPLSENDRYEIVIEG